MSTDIITEQFNRDINCIHSYFRTCIILGLGGTGSNLAMILSTFSHVTNIILIDDDIVELSNLNRTEFDYTDIGLLKVKAIATKISNRNINISVLPIPIKSDRLIELLNETNGNAESEQLKIQIYNHIDTDIAIYDCRDNIYTDYNDITNALRNSVRTINSDIADDNTHIKFYRIGYDGMSITIDLNPERRIILGDINSGYSTIPSHSISSKLAALLVALFSMTLYKDSDIRKLKHKDRTDVVTFDCNDIYKMIFPKLTKEERNV